jgi:Flp pilus assembly protein TadG
MRPERGAAAIEAALVLCFIVIPLVFAAISYAYMFSFRQALSQAASEGARAAVGASAGTVCPTVGPYVSTCPAQQAASMGVANALDTYDMACGTDHLVCTISAPTTTGCASGHTCVSVEVYYPYRSQPLLPSFPGLGFALPPDLTFTSVVEVS